MTQGAKNTSLNANPYPNNDLKQNSTDSYLISVVPNKKKVELINRDLILITSIDNFDVSQII